MQLQVLRTPKRQERRLPVSCPVESSYEICGKPKICDRSPFAVVFAVCCGKTCYGQHLLFSGIGSAEIAGSGDVVETAIVELCQYHQSVHRNAQSAGFIITVSALRYCKYFRNAFLSKRSFLPQSTKSFCVTHK